MSVGRFVKGGPGGAVWLAAALLFVAAPAGAASISPRVMEAARRSAAEAAALQERLARYSETKAHGVDRVYPQFALDMARYPRGGVAHRNILVVLVQFPSEGTVPARFPSKASTPFYYHRVFFSDDPNDGILSLREYYKIQSHGRLIISGEVTSKWMTMPHSYRYYANGTSGLNFLDYPRSAQRLAEEAMAAAYQDFGGKLGFFDNDGPDGVSHSGDDDGYIDAVAVIHVGRGAEVTPDDPLHGITPDDSLWAHEAGVAQYTGCDLNNLQSSPNCVPGFQLGDVKGFLYTMGAEYNDYPGDFSVGTYAHEFGHTLGLPDLYDPNAAGLGFFSLMALGNYLPYEPYEGGRVLGSRPSSLDAWSRQYLGFDEPNILTDPGHYTLAPVTEGGESYKIWSNGEPGTEYYLVEYRAKTGPDEFIPGDGLIIYHVDDTQIDNLSGYPDYRVFLVQADSVNPGQLESPSGNFGDARDPFPGTLGKRSFTYDTTPSSRSLAGDDTGIRIWNIFAGAADSAETASFDLAISTQPELRVAGVTIDDGAGDGYADPGETVTLAVALRNVGLASGALNLTLTTSDSYATVVDGTSSAPAIPGGGTATSAAPLTVTFGSPPIPHDVPFTLSWSDGSASGSVTFTITVGMGAGLAESFEAGLDGWTHAAIPPSGADQWHLSTSRAHEGASSVKIGSTNPLGTGSNEAQTYAANEDAALVSPAFDLAPDQELVFWSYIDAETNGGTGAWDGGRVEISMNGGEWIPLAVDGGYGYVLEFNSSAALRGTDVFSGSPQRWRQVVADLSPYAGAARIRFRFATDEANDPRILPTYAQLRYYEGWYVDEIQVRNRSVTGPTPRKVAFRAGPNPYRLNGPSSGSVLFQFSAPDGLPRPGLRPEVRIYDVRGRQVGRVAAAANPLVPAQFQASWNPRSEGGERLGSGVYFARVEMEGKAQAVRLVLVR